MFKMYDEEEQQIKPTSQQLLRAIYLPLRHGESLAFDFTMPGGKGEKFGFLEAKAMFRKLIIWLFCQNPSRNTSLFECASVD